MSYARLSRWFAGCASALVSALAFAQAPVEVSFYYPVAVGGPITKIIDGYAAEFEKENPGIKLRPIYSGSYQESIAKALTAVKAGDPPVTVDPAVHRHVHADRRGRDRPVRRRHEAGRSGVAQELLSRLHGEQPDRRQDLGHSVPALDDRAVLEQGDVQGRGARSEPAAANLGRTARLRAEAHQARCVGQRHASGASRFRRPAFRTGCSRRSRSRTAST